MRELLCVFVGGGIGSVLRFMASMLWRHMSLHPRFENMIMPWPTLAVNVVGCLLIGVFYVHGERLGLSDEARLLLTTGFCGGLTTFSTFSYESVTLMHNGHYLTAAAYITMSLIIGMAAAFVPMLRMGNA